MGVGGGGGIRALSSPFPPPRAPPWPGHEQEPGPQPPPRHPPPRRKQARDRGGKFAHQRQRHHVSGQRRLPKTHELRAGLQHHDATDEESGEQNEDRKSTRLNSSHGYISYAVFCLKKKNTLSSSYPIITAR